METGASSGPSKNYPAGTPKAESFKRSSDLYMSVRSVDRIMRRALPPGSRIADDSKDMMQECVSKFINLVTSEANKLCKLESRKTVSADDLVAAMESLGFDDYVEPLSVYLDKYRSQATERICGPTVAASAEVVTLPLFPVEPSRKRSGYFVDDGDGGEEGSSGGATI